MKKTLLLIIFIFPLIAFSQETCSSSEEEVVEDLGSITKCSVEASTKQNKDQTKGISVRIFAPKRRYLKKKRAEMKKIASGIDAISTSGVANATSSSKITESLELKKSVADLTNTLSKEEVRKALRFRSVDKIPAFLSCKDAKKSEKSECFNTEMIKHIQVHFNYPEEAVENKIEGDVWVRFIIDSNGNVTNIKTLGPENGELLNEEAKRVVAKLPLFIPATKNGKNVSVKYGFPINFSLQ